MSAQDSPLYTPVIRELVELVMECEQALDDEGYSVLNHRNISEPVRAIIFDLTGKRVGK